MIQNLLIFGFENFLIESEDYKMTVKEKGYCGGI